MNTMNKKIILGLIFSFLLSSMNFVGLASANLVVDPAKLGILRLQLYPLSPAVAIREFRVGNTYDVPMDIELIAVEDMENLITISEPEFTLQANEDKMVEYTVSINEPGYYSGAILVKASVENRTAFGYKADLAVFVNESNLQPYFYVVIAALVITAVLLFSLLFKLTKRKKRKK